MANDYSIKYAGGKAISVAFELRPIYNESYYDWPLGRSILQNASHPGLHLLNEQNLQVSIELKDDADPENVVMTAQTWFTGQITRLKQLEEDLIVLEKITRG